MVVFAALLTFAVPQQGPPPLAGWQPAAPVVHESMSVVDGPDVYGVSSAHFVASGRLGAGAWGPDEDAVAFFLNPRTETLSQEADRMAKGGIAQANQTCQVLVYRNSNNNTVGIGQVWNTTYETPERLCWIDRKTLGILVMRHESSANSRILYVCDGGTGSVLWQQRLEHSVLGMFTSDDGSCSVLVSFNPGSSRVPAPITIHPLARAGMGEPVLSDRSLSGGIAPSTDGKGILCTIDGAPSILRRVNGVVTMLPQGSEDRAHAAIQTKLRRGSLLPIGQVLILSGSTDIPLQPNQAVLGLGEKLTWTVSPSGSSILYELDSAIYTRKIIKLSPPIAQRQQDENEKVQLGTWADDVCRSFSSWEYGGSSLRPASAYPATTQPEFAKFRERLSWKADGKILFTLRGERELLSVDYAGQRKFTRVK